VRLALPVLLSVTVRGRERPPASCAPKSNSVADRRTVGEMPPPESGREMLGRLESSEAMASEAA